MFTYFIFKEFIYNILIEDFFESCDSLEKTCIFFLIFMASIYGIICLLIDILLSPLYLIFLIFLMLNSILTIIREIIS